MRKKRITAISVCVLGMMLLGGCGTEPYVLTEQEQAVVVNYSASVVAKFNTYQKDGLTYLIGEEPEKSEELLDTETLIEEVGDGQESIEGSEGGEAVAEENTEHVGQQAVMNDVFGTGGLDIVYAGSEIKENYVEGTVYSLEADAGKAFLILNFDIINESENDIELDNITSGPIFKASFIDATGEKVNASAYSTILLNDFTTYLDTIAAGETEQAVILFEVSDTVTEVEQLTLQVELNGSIYEINL